MVDSAPPAAPAAVPARPAIKASVVIPAFNAEATLERAIASVFAQGIDEVEVIVVDDVSRDGTAALVERLASGEPRLHLVCQGVNGGPAAARNAGLRAAKGETVCFLDADDEYLPGFLKTCLGVLGIHPAFASVKTDIELAGFDEEIDPQRLGAIINVLPSNVLVRRAAAEVIGGFPEDPAFRGPAAGEDGVFRAVLAKCFAQGYVPRPLLRHHVGNDSHLRLFLGRSAATGDGIAFDPASATAEEASGAIDAASQAFIDRFAARVGAAAGSALAAGSLPFHQLAPLAVGEVAAFQQLSTQLATVPGAIGPREGYLLHLAAAFGPDSGKGSGAVVDMGPYRGLTTAWLAGGLKRAKQGKVVVCDPAGWTAPAGTEPYRRAFERTIAACELGEAVAVHDAPARQVAAAFEGRVRLLVAGPDPLTPAMPSALAAWAVLVAPGGLVALTGVDRSPLMAALADQLAGDGDAWKAAYAIDGLRMFERSGW